jgi:hypothetical protein
MACCLTRLRQRFMDSAPAPQAKASMTTIRAGRAPAELTRAQFHEHCMNRFRDPAFAVEQDALLRLEEIAKRALKEGRKAPFTLARW